MERLLVRQFGGLWGDVGWTVLVWLCCLTSESEEREAWTAEVLADGVFRDVVEETL
jgi:hypothetical protein